MCAIAALLIRSGDAGTRLAPASKTLLHRGPDGTGWAGWWPDGRTATGLQPQNAPIALVHHRLAVIDPTPAAAQPFALPEGILVFNGEIYNHAELAASLVRRGIRPRTHSDTEVLALLLAHDGLPAVDRLRGMFALLWLDLRRGDLLVVRDHLGIKPLYWAEVADGLALASEPKALRTLGAGKAADAQGLWDHLRFGVTDHREQSCLSGIRQVAPGSWMRIDLRAARIVERGRWWGPRPVGGDIGAAFRTSVDRHLVSDVPLGFSLSGGVDSSAIICAAARHRSQLKGIGFASGDAQDETQWMRLAAAAAGADLELVSASPQQADLDLDELIRIQDEPFGGPSLIAQWQVFRRARDLGLTVMLGGQGADELFGGYASAVAAQAVGLARRGLFGQAMRLLSQHPGRWRAAVSREIADRLPGLRAWSAAEPWLLTSWFRDRGVAPCQPPLARGRDRLGRLLISDLTSTTLPMLLRYEDRTSMRFSVENRVPYCDRDLVEAGLAIADDDKISVDGTTKACLREMLRGLVPDAILDRRDKIGFAAPERRWREDPSGPWQRILDAANPAAAPWLDVSMLRRAIATGRGDPSVWRSLIALRWGQVLAMEWP
ncbi:asparagine synthetase B [Planctomycetota bacterium]|nr:asparagine synthetase B [Planctomycetota bacterium]